MAAWTAATPDSLALITRLNAALSDFVGEFKQRNGKWVDGPGEFVSAEIERALAAAETAAIALAHTDESLRSALRDYFLVKGSIDRYHAGQARYDQVALLGDADSVEQVFAAADKVLATAAGEDFNASPLFGVVLLARDELLRDRAIAYLRGAFDVIRKHKKHGIYCDSAYANVARCIAALGDRDLLPELHDAFVFAANEEQNYEMNIAASHIAVYLTALGYTGSLDALRAFITYLEDSYEGEAFTLRARYALWMLDNDGAGATAYLADPARTKSLGLAATACADLHHTDALPVLERRLAELKSAVAKEEFVEAIARLREQSAPPPMEDRMIWMHGTTTVVEQALGADSGSVFKQRASIATDSPIGRVLEVDDSARPDV
jgi:hypothetical protein